MQEKTTKNFDAINKEAVVGNRPKVIVVNAPLPPKDKNGKYILTANVVKRKKSTCSGCSRKKRRG